MMTVEEFRAWLRGRKELETAAVIADSLCAARLTVYQWMWGTRQPGRQVRALAALLAGYPRELAPGLPGRKPYRRQPRLPQPQPQTARRAPLIAALDGWQPVPPPRPPT